MKDSIYLTCNRNGVTGYRKSKPSLNSGEVAIRIDILVPNSYFDRFVPTATITLPDPPPLTDNDISVSYDPLEVVEPDPLDKLFETSNDELAT